MYITINDVIGEKKIDLSYPIRSNKETPKGSCSTEIAVIKVLSDNIQYEIIKPHTIIDNISGDKKLILSRTYKGKELISVLEGIIELTQ